MNKVMKKLRGSDNPTIRVEKRYAALRLVLAVLIALLIAFLLICFTKKDEIYYMPLKDLERFWERAQEGGRKSFRYEEVDQTYRIMPHDAFLVPYLDALALDLQTRDELTDA